MPTRRAIYPGTFDPITKGHLDLISRAAGMFDELIVAVASNDQKRPMFTVEERVSLVEASLAAMNTPGPIRVHWFTGLLADYVAEQGAVTVIRGLRAISDFEFEFQMAHINRRLKEGCETIFLPSHEDYTYLSSRIVKEIARLHGPLDDFVTDPVAAALREKFGTPAAT